MADNAGNESETSAKEGEEQDSTQTEAPESDDWKLEKCRSKIVERIQEEITKTESQVPKSAADLEQFVFSKATSRKSYLDLVARILIYVAEFNAKKEKKENEEKGDEKTEENAEKKGDA